MCLIFSNKKESSSREHEIILGIVSKQAGTTMANSLKWGKWPHSGQVKSHGYSFGGVLRTRK